MDFYKHLETYLTKNEIVDLKNALNNEDLHAILLNSKKMSDETFLNIYPNVKRHPLVKHAYMFDNKTYQLGKSFYHTLGCFYIQEPSAMVVSSLIKFNDNDLVLDMCAAPGGKTIQASQNIKGKGIVIANDISKERCYELSNNIERLGLDNVIITNNDFDLIYESFMNTFDKIILDAPCSGSGMFRKDPKFIEDWSINKVLKYAEEQKKLIKIAYSMLKPGGILSYSTCSYSKEEDEDVISYLLLNSDAQIIDIANPLFLNKGIGVHLMSNKFPGEGQYICQITKPGISNETIYERNSNNYVKQLPFLSKYHINKFGNFLFGLRSNIHFKQLNVIKYGFKIGEIDKDLIKLDYNLSHVISTFDNAVELSDNDLKQYIQGMTLPFVSDKKGYILLKYKNIPLSFGKSDGRIIKNHFPKGLRKNYII
ncbi:MAG: methyltransferase domain-containing protein [Bacilli bacterium]|nr:methyltransferase domain-containing protein [Bacilli bacterium]